MTKPSKVGKLKEDRYHDYHDIVVKLNELIDAFNSHYHICGREGDNTTYPVKGDKRDQHS